MQTETERRQTERRQTDPSHVHCCCDAEAIVAAVVASYGGAKDVTDQEARAVLQSILDAAMGVHAAPDLEADGVVI